MKITSTDGMSKIMLKDASWISVRNVHEFEDADAPDFAVAIESYEDLKDVEGFNYRRYTLADGGTVMGNRTCCAPAAGF